MLQEKDDASGLEEIPALEAEIAELTERRKQVKDEVDDFMRREDPAAGVFHHKEIFEHRQDLLRLEVEIELRRKKINRIRLAYDPGFFR